jgi:hypothetical protein
MQVRAYSDGSPKVVLHGNVNYDRKISRQFPEIFMRKRLWLAAMALLLIAAPARAQSLTLFFNNANLVPLAKSPQLRILAAQPANKMPQADVNAFDDFYLINGPGKLKVHFNGQLRNLGMKALPYWAGNTPYSNHDIFFDLQVGFGLVKTHFNIPNALAGNVTVYKTTNTNEIVYSYAVSLSRTVCQQYLFTPATGGFQRGMQASCYWSL